MTWPVYLFHRKFLVKYFKILGLSLNRKCKVAAQNAKALDCLGKPRTAKLKGLSYMHQCIYFQAYPSVKIFQGWSLFSIGASKVAKVAAENTARISSVATQKVGELSGAIGDRVSI